MTTPKRIQRKRAPGWRMPENTVYVGRPTKWGNPFQVVACDLTEHSGPYREIEGRHWHVGGSDGWVDDWRWADRAEAAKWVVKVFRLRLANPTLYSYDEIQAALAGKDLACWCPLDQPCHADVLLEIANRPTGRPCPVCLGHGEIIDSDELRPYGCSVCSGTGVDDGSWPPVLARREWKAGCRP